MYNKIVNILMEYKKDQVINPNTVGREEFEKEGSN
jgi:hypothetical protein